MPLSRESPLLVSRAVVWFTGPRDPADGPRGIHPAFPEVVVTGDIEVAGIVYRHAFGVGQWRLDRQANVFAVGRLPSSRDGGDSPRGIDPPDAAVAGISDVDVAGIVHRYA